MDSPIEINDVKLSSVILSEILTRVRFANKINEGILALFFLFFEFHLSFLQYSSRKLFMLVIIDGNIVMIFHY
jgi:hypothetical protein